MKKVLGVLLACGVFFSLMVNAAGISRSVFTTEIINKEPAADLKQISVDNTRVYFFTEIQGLNGHTITHRWKYNGKVMAEVSFQVNGDRWRTWSSKNMLASWLGKWQVSVLDEGGNLIDQSEFEYVVSQPEPPAEIKTQMQAQPKTKSPAAMQTEAPTEAQ
jgi:Protein of unknown function (DUF2914)